MISTPTVTSSTCCRCMRRTTASIQWSPSLIASSSPSLLGASFEGATSRSRYSLRSVSFHVVPRMRRATDSGLAVGFTICVTSS